MFEEKEQFQYDYIKEYCKPSKYNCLMPVEYEWNGTEYHKKRMVCHLVKSGECKEETSCSHFNAAPEIPAEGTHLLKNPYK